MPLRRIKSSNQREVEGRHTYCFNGSYTTIVQHKLYYIANFNDLGFQVTVIDLQN